MSPGHWVMWPVVGVVLVAVVLFAIACLATYRATLRQHQSDAERVAMVLENSLTRTLESAETALLTLGDQVGRLDREAGGQETDPNSDPGPDSDPNLDPVARRLADEMAALLRFSPHLREIVIADRLGRVRADTAGRTVGAVLDLPVLCNCQEGPQGLTADEIGSSFSQGLGIGTLVPGRYLPVVEEDRPPSPRAVLPLWIDAGPRTLLIAGLNPDHLYRLLVDAGPTTTGAVRIVHLNGGVVLESGGPDHVLTGRVLPMLRVATDGPSAGLLPILDTGGRRLGDLAYRLSDRYPLAVQVAVSRHDVRITWVQSASGILAWSLLSLVGLVAVGVGLTREVVRRFELEGQVRFLSLTQTVFAHAAEGMVITDAHNRILEVNPAFTDITGYPLAEARGRDPSILASGRHDASFYADMWAAIETEGAWRGEIWNRRRDGSLYAQRLSIARIVDGAGRTLNYIGVFSDVTEQRRQTDAIRHFANHDPLTGLPNRVLLEDRVIQALMRGQREGLGLALLFIDLDGFKPVNDRFGHALGDVVLKEVAVRIAEAVRESDTVARLGGDEFVVLLLGVQGGPAAETIARKILARIVPPIDLGENRSARVGASIGVALYPTDGTDGKALMDAADAAMYRAKAEGRGRICRAAPVRPGSPPPPPPPPSPADGSADSRVRVAADPPGCS